MKSKIILVVVILITLTLSSCDRGHQFEYITSPDGKYILEVETTEGAMMSSPAMWVRISKVAQGKGQDWEDIFFGRAGFDNKVFWASEKLVMIDYCMGYINEFNTPFYDKQTKQEIYFHITTAPGISVNDKVICKE